jgi:hypothetical protein
MHSADRDGRLPVDVTAAPDGRSSDVTPRISKYPRIIESMKGSKETRGRKARAGEAATPVTIRLTDDERDAYGAAAEGAGQSRLARAHLLMMAEVIEDRDLLVTIAESLIELGDAENADRVYGHAYGCSYEHRMDGDADQRWQTVLHRITEEKIN